MLTFKANYIKDVTIQKYDYHRNLVDAKAAFVEINPLSEQDMYAVNKVSLSWDNCSGYAGDIAQTVNKIYIAYDDRPKERFFGLTRQHENFDKLSYDEILGLMQVTEEKGKPINVDYLQVNPEHQAFSVHARYKHIGKMLIDTLKDMNGGKTISLHSVRDAVGFYIKQGFKKVKLDREYMEYIMRK